MRLIKTFGLATLAAVWAMALVGASSAVGQRFDGTVHHAHRRLLRHAIHKPC